MLDYTQLLIDGAYKYQPKSKETKQIYIYAPTVGEIVSDRDSLNFSVFTKIFLVSMREIYASAPEMVDMRENEFPTLWDVAYSGNEAIEKEVVQLMFSLDIPLLALIVQGIAYWTRTDVADYKILTNGKVVNEKLNWIVEKDDFLAISEVVKTITMYAPNEDLIPPRNMKPNQMDVWKKLYEGRMRQLKRKPGSVLADKILILQISANSYIPLKEIEKMNYLQFMGLLKGYAEKEGDEKQFAQFVAYKFDSSKMEITNWRENISLVNK